MSSAVVGALMAAHTVGCSSAHPGAAPPEGVPAGAFALVAGAPLSLSLLSGASEGRSLDPKAVVHDALFAQAAEAEFPERARVVARGALARGLFTDVRDKALSSGGPVTEAERAAQSKALWKELDRPRSVRTGRAFLAVRTLENDDEVFAAVSKVHEAVRGATSLDAFGRGAQKIDVGDRELILELLPPVAPDGRIVPQSPADELLERLDPAYGAAAAELTEVGQISDIVGTSDGYQVIVATDIVPGFQEVDSVRNDRLNVAVGEARAAGTLDAIQGRAKDTAVVRINPKHRTLTRLAWRTR